MNPFCMITFPKGEGDPKGGAFGGEVLVTLAAGRRLFEQMGNAIQRSHDGLDGKIELESGPGMQLELPNGDVAIIEPDDVGLLVVEGPDGFYKLNVTLGQVPTSAQCWSAADLCDAMAKHFMTLELRANSEAGGGARKIALPRQPGIRA